MTANRIFHIACIVGARPNFIKIAPILRAFDRHGGFSTQLIHTGQHYDFDMNSVFFEQLGLPQPNINLGIGSGSQTVQTARMMIELEQVFEAERPDLLVVVGDVNSTLAAALVAAKMRIPVAHVEAGLRSFDMNMPEEVNRIVTDRLSDLLLTTERAAQHQLEREGVRPESIFFVGNVMIDTLLANIEKAIPVEETVNRHLQGMAPILAQGYALVTLHRPSNVDKREQLSGLFEVLGELANEMPVLFPMHPRTRARIEACGQLVFFQRSGLIALPPLGYFEMLGALRTASLVITDSGGLQEETTALGVPCLTVRDNTERPITITEGTNTLVGSSPNALRAAIANVIRGETKRGRIPELWDGMSAHRIVSVIANHLSVRQT